jgi:hypothetical protein
MAAAPSTRGSTGPPWLDAGEPGSTYSSTWAGRGLRPSGRGWARQTGAERQVEGEVVESRAVRKVEVEPADAIIAPGLADGRQSEGAGRHPWLWTTGVRTTGPCMIGHVKTGSVGCRWAGCNAADGGGVQLRRPSAATRAP